MQLHIKRLAVASALLALPSLAGAKPIAFANGTTVMAEYGGDTMIEAQAFYAPSFRYSVGLGRLRLTSGIDDAERDISYARFNYLPKRWNMEAAQANIFVWGSIGGARTSETKDTQLAYNIGGQFDYETRRVYFSARTEYHESKAFAHRFDTAQFGIAPYKHDYQTLAAWFVVQARNYTGGLYDGLELAGLIRFFKRNTWLEAGLTEDGKLQAMVMFNF